MHSITNFERCIAGTLKLRIAVQPLLNRFRRITARCAPSAKISLFFGGNHMKRKRISAVMTAAACAAVMLSSMPVSFAQASQFVQNDFETTYGGWYSESANDAAVITAIDGIGFNGSRGMQITGRTDSQDGPVSEKDLFLVGGQRFEYSVRVKADSDQRFTFSVQTTDPETGGVTVKVLDKQYVKAGQWATLSGSYKAPANAQSFKLKITTDSTADFIFDDVIVTGKGALVASGKFRRARRAGRHRHDFGHEQLFPEYLYRLFRRREYHGFASRRCGE